MNIKNDFFINFKQKLLQWTEKQIYSPVSTIPFALFRIGFGCIILGTVWQLYEFKELIYDEIPFYKSQEINIKLPLFFWILVSISLILGLFTKWMSIANFVFAFCFIYPLQKFSYAFDSIFLCVSAWMMFAPIQNRFSLDKFLILKFHKKSLSNCTISLYGQILILLNITWVYVDAGIQKIQSELWQKGIGFWRYASIPSISSLGWQEFLNNQVIVYGVNYGIILFQLFFPIFLIIKRVRWIIVVVGISIHFSILLFFPIKLFSIAECFLYIFLIPHEFWNRFENNNPTKSINPKNVLYYAYFQAYIFFFYAIIWTQHEGIKKVFSPFLVVNKPFLGMVQHYLFIDKLQKENDFIYSIVYISDNKEIFLPIINQDGKADEYLSGRIWSHWDYVSNSTYFTEKELIESSQKFITYWIGKIKLENNEVFYFKIKRKPILIPSHWELNLWENNLKTYWEDYLILKLENGNFNIIN
jgi:hypothetical protein